MCGVWEQLIKSDVCKEKTQKKTGKNVENHRFAVCLLAQVLTAESFAHLS